MMTMNFTSPLYQMALRYVIGYDSSRSPSWFQIRALTFLKGVTPQGLSGSSGIPAITSLPPGSH